MHLVDLTMFYAAESGGVRRYLTAKQHWLRDNTAVRHTLLVPGDRDESAPGCVTVKSPAIPFGNGYRLPLRLRRWRRALGHLRPDVIEAGDPYQLAWAALAARRELGVPVVGFYHSDLPRLVATRLGERAGALARDYTRDLYGRFDLVLAPSRVMVDRLRDLGVERVRHQPLGVDTHLFHPGARDVGFRSWLGLSADTRLLTYVGRFSREKNLPLLFEAVRRLGRPYHLLLIGSGDRPRRAAGVTYVPFQREPQRLAAMMASCDALVHPGEQETFGLVVLEALACGVPVVGMAAGGVAELVDERVGVLAEPGRAASFAAAVDALFQRDLSRLGADARARAVSAYDWGRVLPQIIARYQRLCAGRAHRNRADALAHAVD